VEIFKDELTGTPEINPKRAVTGRVGVVPSLAHAPEAEELRLAPSGLRVELLWEDARPQILDRLGVGLLQKGVRPQDRRTVTIVIRAATKGVSSDIIVGFTGITDEIVEGDVRGVPVPA
jgi:hypothetical protein